MKNNLRKNAWLTSRALALIGCLLTVGITSAAEQVSGLDVDVNFSKSIGKLKALHGVNGGPRTVGRHSGDLVTLHKEAGFPSVRLHDCNWPHPDVVDIPTIFPLFHLDADDPKNYQFAMTDAYQTDHRKWGDPPIPHGCKYRT